MPHTVSSRAPKAFKAGHAHGCAQASWVLDGNSTPQDALWLIKGITEGDPEVMDLQPNPLSGEWAGESMKEVESTHNCQLRTATQQDNFEQGFSEGFWATVTEDAHALACDCGCFPPNYDGHRNTCPIAILAVS